MATTERKAQAMTPAQQAKAEANRKMKALACAKALEAASNSLSEFLIACNDCNDASASRGADDGRVLLMRNINEFKSHLTSVFDK